MTKTINQSPTVADTILFALETPGVNGLLTSDPVLIERIVIYYIERDFGKINDKSYEMKHFDIALEREVDNARMAAQTEPSPENIERLAQAKIKLDAASIKHNFYFNDAKPVYTIGSKEAPAFLATDPMASAVKAVIKNEHGHEQFGRFQFTWDTAGNREGDYFISWSWMPAEDQPLLTAHQMFRLGAVQGKNTYISTRYTQDQKYETLLDRYTPEMYKTRITNTDLTPYVLGRFHLCIARGFTQLEDMANHLADMYDANTTHEAILPLLSNMFNLKLKSNNSTLWRRQIKQAVPLFKRKGTLSALREALDQAGIKLLKLTKLWQVVSEYSWVDGFVKSENDAIIGVLSKSPIDTNDIEVRIKASDSDEFLLVPKEAISFSKTDNDYTVMWLGELLETSIPLYDGDVVLVKYQTKTIPPERQAIEKYIQSLPLADQRDPTAQKFPLKNWNVRLIEEDDPLFDVIVHTRYPAYDPVIFGKVRTTFLYSEKVYNMDTYNGSLRNSKVPCDIDKDFIDECSYCQSGKFNIDIEIENLSSDRIDEAKEIIKEYSPFHAILHSINVSGTINEFVVSPVESIESLVNVIDQETIKTRSVKDAVVQQEVISYEIEWADGSKEKSQQVGAI